MESVGQPDIDIDDHGSRPDGSERAFTYRNRMLVKCTVEVLVQQNAVLP